MMEEEEEELEELAQDIKANGLQQPLVVDYLNGQEMLIDGRNRREACKRVGIVPHHVLLDGQDAVTYILSANINRRHLTKAAVVLKHAPDLANNVIMGHLSLDNAYEEARVRKGRAETYESRFNALKAAAPDLAEMVTDGPLNLEEAQAAYDQRVSEEERRKKGMARCLHELAMHSDLLERQREQVAVFGQLATELHPMLKKGAEVYCEGRLRLDSWTGDLTRILSQVED